MISFKRGEIILINLEPTIGSEQRGICRPGLVVSPGALNDIFRGLIICPITNAQHVKQSELGLTFIPASESGLEKNSLVIAFQVRMIDKRRVIRKLGSVLPPTMLEVTESLKAVLDI